MPFAEAGSPDFGVKHLPLRRPNENRNDNSK